MATVLVIEDEAVIREVIADLLEVEGYRVMAAADGAALTAALTVRADLILLDLRLAGMDGDELLTRLQADPATRHIPVVVMSAGADLRAYEDHPGVATTLAKPFDLDVLLALVWQLAGPAS